jgi:hypothetical protein
MQQTPVLAPARGTTHASPALTIANMTAALEYVCNKIPADKDGHEIRKRIADAIMACGHAGRRTLVDFQETGLEVLEEIVRPSRFNWFGLRPKRPR